MQELHPEYSAWTTRVKTNAILADIYDNLANINANLIAIGSGRPARKPKEYPRPTNKDDKDTRHIGKGALPPDELEKWFEERRQNARGSKRDANDHPGDR